MEYQIIQINHNSWRIEDSGVRFFVLTGQDRALLIDSGRNVHTARDIAATLTNLPIMLLNTHADGDHVGSNAQFESFYMHPDEEPNYRRGDRLLFIAHREEILKQSLYTFRAVLRNANFGDMFVGGYRPDSIDHLFMSIQTFNSNTDDRRSKDMAISYNKLWKLLVDKKMSKADLRRAAGIAPNTMTKLRRDEEVTLTVLNKICAALGVNIGDIMEFLPDSIE